MSQNVPKAHTCTEQYCYMALDASVKGVQYPYHAEQAKSAKKRQQDNKYAQSIIAAPSAQVHKPLNVARGKHNPLTNCALIVELPSQMIIDLSGDEKPQVKHLIAVFTEGGKATGHIFPQNIFPCTVLPCK